MANEELIDTIVETANQANQLDAPAQRMVVTMYRLLADAKPVSAARFGDALQLSREMVDHIIAMLPPGALDRDEEGNVIAFAGLTLKQTEHRMEIDGKTLHTWCAFDTLFLSALLRKSAEITSKNPVSGEPVHFTFGPGGYNGSGDIVMSLVKTSPEQMRNNVRAAFCHSVYFFGDADVATPYLEEHPDLVTIPMSDAITLAKRWNEKLYGEALTN